MPKRPRDGGPWSADSGRLPQGPRSIPWGDAPQDPPRGRRSTGGEALDEHEDPALGEDHKGGAGGAADDPEQRARQVCLRLLTLAPRTRAQLADALRKRGIPDETADEVLSRFQDVGLIDDAAFARAWVESRHYGRGLAGRALSAELKQRGVAADEIRAAIEEGLGPDAEASAARRLIDRKLESTRGLPPEQRTRRLAGMLARKGYPAGLAFRVIREALEAEGDLAFPEDEVPFDEADSDTE
jgi:SOS response regulatory protein OraA/RecX